MTKTLDDRLDDVQRQYVEMEHNTASLQNAQQAATRSAETRYNTLTYKCEQEIRVRQQVMDVLKLERRFIISVAMIAAAVGALGVGLTSEAARWLWATFLAVSARRRGICILAGTCGHPCTAARRRDRGHSRHSAASRSTTRPRSDQTVARRCHRASVTISTNHCDFWKFCTPKHPD